MIYIINSLFKYRLTELCKMTELKICRICLRTEAKMHHFDVYQLKSYYEEVLALKVLENDGLPQYFCYECATILHKFHKFKEKCYLGQKVLKDMILWKGLITYEAVYKIDRKSLNLISPLQILDGIKTDKIYQIKDELLVQDKEGQGSEKEKLSIKVELNNEELSDSDNDDPNYDPIDWTDRESSPITVFVGANETVDTQEKLDVRKTKRATSKLLDENNWKMHKLTEEEALQAFRARADNERYQSASHKCTGCFKAFSKEGMVKRHMKLRHDKSIGPYECRFCKMRFKLECMLRKHVRQHYVRYQCLRCDVVCPLETTAMLHEDYHSGVTKKCSYCKEEFRHASTYYTHLRTHRSNYVCTLCGLSFVSDMGLHQHKRVKHCTNDEESPDDDDEEVNTYCGRCDIRFETRKAYVEHVFHSTMHTCDGDDEVKKYNKILGKKTQNEIKKKLDNRKVDVIPLKVDKRRLRRARKVAKKPTTCHQCGKHFETQSACLKHHLAEHPRTSFFPPTERVICEVCGASLAPGSIAIHQNMHTRETVHPCDQCGKAFHSQGGLKRHRVTHTGEKPFACSLCDKRFTQSNSMKLHYRTYHLKEPYPKRNRRKKKEPKESTGAESCSEESENNTETKKTKPAQQSEQDMQVLESTDMQYLTIGY